MQTVQIREHGDPSVLEVVDRPRPEPGPGEVLCRVLALSVNHLDLWVRRGMPGVRIPMPRVPGCDGTGEVVGLGEGVSSRLELGMPVLLEPGFTESDSHWVREGLDHLADDYQIRGEHCDGYAREYVVLPERYALPLPDGLDPIDTAATPLVFVTAWGLLHLKARVQAGERVLVLGGASGVGSAAIQMARVAGAQVIATASREAGRELCLELGAERAVDHSDPEWGRAVREWSGGRGVDVVVEHIGPATWDTCLRLLARNGRLVTCGGTTGPKVSLLLPHLFMKNQSVLGSTMGPRSAFPTILERLASGSYRPVVDRRLPLSEVAHAHQLLEDRQVTGKIVLVPGS